MILGSGTDSLVTAQTAQADEGNIKIDLAHVLGWLY